MRIYALPLNRVKHRIATNTVKATSINPTPSSTIGTANHVNVNGNDNSTTSSTTTTNKTIFFYAHIPPSSIAYDPHHINDPNASKFNKFLNKGSTKAFEFWESLGKKPQGSFLFKTYEWGNKNFLDKIEWQEWFLKSIPGIEKFSSSSSGTKIPKDVDTISSSNGTIVQQDIDTDTPNQDITHLYVHHPSDLSPEEIQQSLRDLVATRLPYHQKYLYLSVGCLPLSFLFSIVPGPNLPLLYNAFRIYSHSLALKGGKTLRYLINESGEVEMKQKYNVEYVPDQRLDVTLVEEEAITEVTDRVGIDGFKKELTRAAQQIK